MPRKLTTSGACRWLWMKMCLGIKLPAFCACLKLFVGVVDSTGRGAASTIRRLHAYYLFSLLRVCTQFEL